MSLLGPASSGVTVARTFTFSGVDVQNTEYRVDLATIWRKGKDIFATEPTRPRRVPHGLNRSWGNCWGVMGEHMADYYCQDVKVGAKAKRFMTTARSTWPS
jgi:hypothetical protein